MGLLGQGAERTTDEGEHAMQRWRRMQGDRGAATIELTAMQLAVSVVICSVVVVLMPQAPVLGDRVRQAFCIVFTMGQGDCSMGHTSPAAHEPVKPCVVSSTGSEVTRSGSVLFFTGKDGSQYEVAKMSDGRIRITRSNSGSGGVTAGVGGGLTVTVNDQNYGGSATADASATVDLQTGETYYFDDEKDAARYIQEASENLTEDAIFGSGTISRDVWEGLQGAWGWVSSQFGGSPDYDFPDPDETTIQGGFSVEASAGITGSGITNTDENGYGLESGSAHAEVGLSEAAGMTTKSDGTKIFYIQSTVSGEAALQLSHYDTKNGNSNNGATAGGELTLMHAIEVGPDGNIRNVTTTATAGGEVKGLAAGFVNGNWSPDQENSANGLTVYQATLPVSSETDKQLALDYLTAQGITMFGSPIAQATTMPEAFSSMNDFMQAARDRGYVTKQTMTNENTNVFAINGSGELGVELGAGFDYSTSEHETTGAQYWDGTQWVDWADCHA